MEKTCKDFEVDLTHYADGFMADVRDKAGLEEHLKGCEACQKRLKELQESATFLAAAKQPSGQFQQRMEELRKKSEIQQPPQTAETMVESAQKLIDKEDYNAAIDVLNKAIELNPKNANTYWLRGRAYLYIKESKAAISDFSKVIDLNPKEAYAYWWRGVAYLDIKESRTAISDFSKAIDLNPNNANAYWGRGRAYYFNKQHKESIADFSKAIDLNPKGAYDYLWRGKAYYKNGQYKDAVKDLSESIKLKKIASAYLWRGRAYQKLGDIDRAVKDFEKALKIDPANKVAKKELIQAREDQAQLFGQKMMSKLTPAQLQSLKILFKGWDKDPEIKKIKADLKKVKKTYATKKELDDKIEDLKMPSFGIHGLLSPSTRQGRLPLGNRNRIAGN